MNSTLATSLLAASLALSSGLGAEQTVYGQAGVSAPWLKMPSSARSLAMGEASAALSGQAANLGSNPATLAGLQSQEASFMHNSWLLGAAAENLAYAAPLFKGAGLGGAVSYVNLGSVDSYTLDSSTNQLQKAGSINPYGMSAALAYGQELGQGLSLGLSARFLTQNLDGTAAASSFAGDLGGQWSSPGKGYGLGIALQNFGGALEGSGLPLNLKFGGMAGFKAFGDSRLNLAADLNYPTADAGAFSAGLGLELWAQEELAIRAGYKIARSGNLGGSLSAGLGYRMGWGEVNYAFTTFGETGNANVLELVARFGGKSKSEAAPEPAPAAVPAKAQPKTKSLKLPKKSK